MIMLGLLFGGSVCTDIGIWTSTTAFRNVEMSTLAWILAYWSLNENHEFKKEFCPRIRNPRSSEGVRH